MGQKVNPNGLRIGINRGWSSQWYAEKGAFAKNIKQDNAIRKFLTTPNKELATKKVAAPASKPAEEVKAEDGAKVAPVAPKGNANIGKLIKDAGLSRIDILRVGNDKLSVVIHVMKPGIVLGQDGANLVFIKNGLEKIVNGRVTKKQLDPKNKKPGDVDIKIVIVEVKNPNLDATLVARDVADQIENRASFRMVQKKAIQRVMRAGAKGIKTSTGGRLNGAEIARTESYREGPLGLMTLSQNIDYSLAEAHTIYGVIGVKVWIARPEGFDETKSCERAARDERKGTRRPFNKDKAGNNSRFHGQRGQGRPQTAPAPVPSDEKKGE